ncbi:MAG: tetratricopeptide repeat protein [Armatimonadota bacterium]
MAALPTGTVTFFFTDIEGSTRLLQQLGDAGYADVLAEHRRMLRAAFKAEGGHEIETQGDGFLFAFQSARGAVLAALAAQRALTTHPWPKDASLRVRMGLHAGGAVVAAEGYIGLDVHRAARICAAGHGGQILMSEGTRDLIGPELPEDAGLRDLGLHRLKDLQQPERVFQLVHPDLPATFPPLQSLDSLPNNLPRQLTSFVGREREMAEVRGLLFTTPLLTLTGPGGGGKTRLALQTAAELLQEFADGAWLVDLAALSDATLVAQTVASSLRVREQPGRSVLTTLTEYLRPKQLLLVLDNCEHLVAGCAEVAAALLRACPRLRILVTSREALRVGGELVWPVPSLSTPDPERPPAADILTRFEASRLFVERALAVNREFSVAGTAAVAQICRRLDGIPLAIELAAARTNVLTVEQIAARLDDRFHLLTAGSRTAPPRHQTLQAAIDWSHDLLAESERVMLRRLSVFAGGFTLEGAEAVCAWEGVREFDVLDLLSQLVDKSLLLVEQRGTELRYRLLETIRQYAEERLRASGDEAVLRARHRDWFLRLAEQAEPAVRGPEQAAWLERLDADHDNLRMALEFCMAEGGENGLRLAAALWPFWEIRGHMAEGRRRLTAALSVAGAMVQSPSGAKALTAAGVLAYRQGDHTAARGFLEQSLAISRTAGDSAGVAMSLNSLGNVARDEGDFAAAASFYKESLAIRRALDDKRGVAYTLNNLGNVVRAQGDYASARALFEEALASLRPLGDRHAIGAVLGNLGFTAWEQGDHAASRAFQEEALEIYRVLGDKPGIGNTLSYLGLVASAQGDHASARVLFEESVTIRREVGDRRGLAYTLGNLAQNALERGDDVSARALLEETLTIQREIGDKRGIAYSLERFAGLAAAGGRHERAARLFGGAEALRERIGAPLSPTDRTEYDRGVAAVRAALTGAALEAAWAAGRAMAQDQAVEFALAAEA